MTERQIRRAAEHKARKEAYKQQQQARVTREAFEPLSRRAAPEAAFEAPPSPQRRSTGPITPEGKAISSLNHLKHGLTGAFRVLQFESQNEFDCLRDALIADHAPAT